MQPLEQYLRDVSGNRSTGAATDETAHYTPLANLLNAVGDGLKPRVRCVMGLKDQGAGMPGGGLFTPDQYQRGADQPLPGKLPADGSVALKTRGSQHCWPDRRRARPTGAGQDSNGVRPQRTNLSLSAVVKT